MMIRYLCFAVAITIMLTGCATPQPLPPVKLSNPDADERSVLIQAVLSGLKDPDSAKFSDDMILVDDKGACVEVNAKNAFGGYTGYQQAVLFKLTEGGWTVVSIKEMSRDLCIKGAHAVVNKNRF